MEFTSWDAGLIAVDRDYLEHYGIPGMKWGVRKYQNRDGSLTAAGQKRYGVLGRGAGAGKMTRDLNKLDKGYANVEARRRSNAAAAGRLAYKMNKALAKGKTAKAEKLRAKAVKRGLQAAEANRAKKSIENLQWRIISKAAQKGYTTNSEPVRRIGQDGKTRLARFLAGPIGTTMYSAIKRGKNVSEVDGQNFKVSRRGDRTTNVVNYNQANKERVRQIMQEDRDKELAKKYANTRR